MTLNTKLNTRRQICLKQKHKILKQQLPITFPYVSNKSQKYLKITAKIGDYQLVMETFFFGTDYSVLVELVELAKIDFRLNISISQK